MRNIDSLSPNWRAWFAMLNNRQIVVRTPSMLGENVLSEVGRLKIIRSASSCPQYDLIKSWSLQLIALNIIRPDWLLIIITGNTLDSRPVHCPISRIWEMLSSDNFPSYVAGLDWLNYIFHLRSALICDVNEKHFSFLESFKSNTNTNKRFKSKIQNRHSKSCYC